MKPSMRIVLAAAVLVLAVIGVSGASSAAPSVSIADASVSGVGQTSASVSWSTSRKADGRVRYGPTADYGSEIDTPSGTRHRVSLSGLSPATRYFVEVRAVHRSGSTDTVTLTFETAADTPPSTTTTTAPSTTTTVISTTTTAPSTTAPSTTVPSTTSTTQPPPEPADTFACLSDPSVQSIDTTWEGGEFVGRIRPGHVGTGVALDLRGATISVHDPADDALDTDGDPVIDSRWGMVQIDSSVDLCVAGGEIVGSNPLDITWAENYDNVGPTGYRMGTTRNNTAIDLADSASPTVNGLSFFNVHDGPRVSGSSDWTLAHLWGDYTRDDCVENDEIASGAIVDSLFDGCYTGYSNRAISATDGNGDLITGAGDVVTFDRVLLRMEMMPGPHKACERTHLYYDIDRQPYDASTCVDREVYGNGPLFKLVTSDTPNAVDPAFRLIDSVFVIEPYPMGDDRADFPDNIVECRNVVVIYRGEGPYPGTLPPAGCHTLLTGAEGEAAWVAAVADWHQRHPDVAPGRKSPSTYGDLSFPR